MCVVQPLVLMSSSSSWSRAIIVLMIIINAMIAPAGLSFAPTWGAQLLRDTAVL